MNSLLITTAVIAAGFLFHPRLLKSRMWRATVTPLASIVGSGFLVSGPILAHAAGTLAWLAMGALCALAYLFGGAIRHNIQYVEPEIGRTDAAFATGLERLSDLALSLAYFVSVAYYLNLFAAYALRTGDVVDPFWVRTVATAVIASVGLLGVLRGLKGLERLEVDAVGLKLSIIVGLLVTLAVSGVLALSEGSFRWSAPLADHGLEEFRVVLGLVILVQGFETSRYLGEEYDAKTRITTMRRAQWISTVIYLAFILLITRYFTGKLPEEGGETQIITMLAPLASFVGPVLIVAALASQLSAAIADMNGASGLLAETSRHRIGTKIANLVIALVAIAITWVADIYAIIVYASKAFVIYYALQSLQALVSAWRRGQRIQAFFFGLGFVIAVVVVVWAVPADA